MPRATHRPLRARLRSMESKTATERPRIGAIVGKARQRFSQRMQKRKSM